MPPRASAPCARRSIGATTSSTQTPAPLSRPSRSSRRLHHRGRPDHRRGRPALACRAQAKSLIARRGERLVMLETLRDYAAERLADRADADEIRSRHAQHFLRSPRTVKLGSTGRTGSSGGAAWTPKSTTSARRLPGWWPPGARSPRWRSPACCSHSGDRGWHDREIRGWLNTALSLADDTTPPAARARALLASSRGALLASLRFSLLDPEQAERDATSALELYRQLDDLAGIAESLVSLGYRQVCLGGYRQGSALADRPWRPRARPAISARSVGRCGCARRRGRASTRFTPSHGRRSCTSATAERPVASTRC